MQGIAPDRLLIFCNHRGASFTCRHVAEAAPPAGQTILPKPTTYTYPDCNWHDNITLLPHFFIFIWSRSIFACSTSYHHQWRLDNLCPVAALPYRHLHEMLMCRCFSQAPSAGRHQQFVDTHKYSDKRVRHRELGSGKTSPAQQWAPYMRTIPRRSAACRNIITWLAQ